MVDVRSHLDELAGHDAFFQGGAHLVLGEIEIRVVGGDVFLDCLDTRPGAILQGLDGLEHHLQENEEVIGYESETIAITFAQTPSNSRDYKLGNELLRTLGDNGEDFEGGRTKMQGKTKMKHHSSAKSLSIANPRTHIIVGRHVANIFGSCAGEVA